MLHVNFTIPVLNEEKTLEVNVKNAHRYIKDNLPELGFKIVIADNGSTDSTEVIAQKLVKEFQEIEYIKIPKKGVGLALDTSWSQSDADYVGYFDLDLSTDLKHLKDVISLINESKPDIIYGSRLAKTSKVVGRSLKREIVSRCFNSILKLYFQTKFSDGMCGFKFLKRDSFLKIKETGLKNEGWFFSTELLVRGEHLKMNIVELPVKWVDEEESKVKIFNLSLRYLKDMKKLKHQLSNIKL